MFKTDCIYHLTTSNNRKIALFMHGEKEVLVISNPGGVQHKYEDTPVGEVYQNLIRVWKMAGIHVTKVTNYLINPDNSPAWYSEEFNLIVWLRAMYNRDRPDLGELENTHEHAWYLKLSRPFEELVDNDDTPDVFDYGLNGRTFTEEFTEFLVSGIHEHGFQYDTPPSAYSPTGQMYNRFSGNIYGKRAVIKNMWSLDC